MTAVLTAGWIWPASGCDNSELEVRVAELESELAELKKQVEAAPKPAPSAKPGAKQPNPNAQAAAELFRAANALINSGNRDGAIEKLDELSTKYGDTPAAKNGAQLKRELLLVGKPAAQMQVEKWYQGNVASMDKPTLLVFWELWCPHCKREVPKIEATYNTYKSKGLQVVGLTKQTRNTSDDKVQAFIQEKGVTYPIGREAQGAMSQNYAVSGIPAAAMVKDGKVVWRGHPGRLTNEMIEGWL